MFYSHDLLRLNGKFAVVWLLGNAPGAHSANRRRSGGGGGGGRVSKSDVLRTDIGAVCLEICALLPVTSSNRGHVSLRMAATLYLGTVDCHARQVQFLIRDMRLFKPLKHQPGAKGAGGAGGPIDCDGGPITLADLDLDGDTVRAKKKKSGANTVGRRCPRGAAAVTLAAPQMGDEADLNGTLAGAGRFCVPEEQITIREPQDLRFGGMGLEEEEGDFGFGETLGTTQGKALEDATAFQGILGEDDDEEDYGLLGDVQPPQAITEPDKEGDEDGGMERLEEANGTKQHPKKSEEPGAPKRPRSPRRREDEVTRAETPDEEGEDGKEKPKKRRRRDNRGEGEEEELLTPPPFPDMPQEEEEAEGVARGAPEAQRQQEEERDTGSPLPTLATPQGEETLGGTRRKKRGGKKKRQLVDKSKEMQRRDFEKNLADVGDIMTDGAVLPNPGRLSLRMGNNNWLRETTRRLGNAELREECLERMVAKVDLDDQEPEEDRQEKEADEEEEEVDPAERSLPREGSVRRHPSSLFDENSRLRSVSGISGVLAGSALGAGAMEEQVFEPGVGLAGIGDEEDDFGLGTIAEEQPPNLDVSPIPAPPPPKKRAKGEVAKKGKDEASLSGSQQEGTVEEEDDFCILSLASSDALDPERLDDRVGELTEGGRRETTFDALADMMGRGGGAGGKRRAAALAFYNLLQLEAEGKVQTRQEEAFGEIKVFYLLNR